MPLFHKKKHVASDTGDTFFIYEPTDSKKGSIEIPDVRADLPIVRKAGVSLAEALKKHKTLWGP